MNGRKTVEVVYSEGVVYKEVLSGSSEFEDSTSKRISDNCVSTYYDDDTEPNVDKNSPYFSVKEYEDKESVIKRYYTSSIAYKMIEGIDSKNGYDLSQYDLCPEATMWFAIGKYDKGDRYDLYFQVETDKQLTKIAKYYNLKNPLPRYKSLEVNERGWNCVGFSKFCAKVNPNFKSIWMDNFKYGSVKFVNNKPKIIKMYESNIQGN